MEEPEIGHELSSNNQRRNTYRCPDRELVVCGRSSVRNIGPPFHVDEPLILTLTPCFSAVATTCYDIEETVLCILLTSWIFELTAEGEPRRGFLSLDSSW